MNIDRSDEYEAPTLSWLAREATRMNSCLLEAGVTSQEQRRATCDAFFFGLGAGFEEPVTANGQSYLPSIALATADSRLLLPTEMFDLHEYALSIVGEAFGEN